MAIMASMLPSVKNHENITNERGLACSTRVQKQLAGKEDSTYMDKPSLKIQKFALEFLNRLQ